MPMSWWDQCRLASGLVCPDPGEGVDRAGRGVVDLCSFPCKSKRVFWKALIGASEAVSTSQGGEELPFPPKHLLPSPWQPQGFRDSVTMVTAVQVPREGGTPLWPQKRDKTAVLSGGEDSGQGLERRS